MKQYDRVEELALNFTVVHNDFGETQVGHAPTPHVGSAVRVCHNSNYQYLSRLFEILYAIHSN